jgi:competence protein ComEC
MGVIKPSRLGGSVFWEQKFAAEQDRWPLWLSVALGAGAGGYFALPDEPSLFCGILVLALAAAATALAALGRMRWPLALLAALLRASAWPSCAKGWSRHQC